MSEDLIDWLRAQFDVDERVARAAQDLERDVFDGTGVIVMHAATGTRSVTLSSAVAIHIADHDPARVLREVEAKRRRVDLYAGWRDQPPEVELHHLDPRWVNISTEEAVLYYLAADLLKLEALPYSDRPGFREEWRLGD